MKLKGISNVVVTVLLTVIGIVAVLLFWSMFSGLFNPTPKVIIEQASAISLGNGVYEFTIQVREVGGASTTIDQIILEAGTQTYTLTPTQPGGSSSSSGSSSSGITLGAGQSITIVARYNGQLNPGQTYYLRVAYTVGNGIQYSDAYPVTIR